MRRTQRRGERGQALVEASFSLMVFLMLLFLIFDFGFALFLQESFVEQARAGARWGAACLAAAPSCSTAQVKNIVLYNKTTGDGNGMYGLEPGRVTVATAGTAGAPDYRVVVTISGYSFWTITPGWAGRHTGRTIQLAMPVEQ